MGYPVLGQGDDQGHGQGVTEVSQERLEANMVEYFRRVEETGEELIVTDNGRPVVKVVRIRARTSAILAPTACAWPEA